VPKKSPFIDTQTLFENLNNPEFSIVDASWYMPNSQENALDNFRKQHIPGAVYFDLDNIADTSSSLPHMVASPEKFSKMVGELGISENDTIVVYDSSGLFSAARVWWNFKVMGAKNCFVLRGGLPRWVDENRPLASGEANHVPKKFNAKMGENSTAAKTEIEQISAGDRDVQIVDVRSSMRFLAQAPEPRPGMRSGRIPGSVNLPFMDLIKDGQMIAAGEISKKISAANIDLKKSIIASCGSGVTAPIMCLALAEIGVDSMRIYDGSWSEWGQPGSHPVLGSDGELV